MVAAGKKRRRSGDGSGYGYVVWADRDSGRTSKCKMRSGSVMAWLLRQGAQWTAGKQANRQASKQASKLGTCNYYC